jgi:hypothetical protein
MQFYIETTTTVLENTNQFFAENKEQMTSVIPTYLEVLSHFITKIKDVRIIYFIINRNTLLKPQLQHSNPLSEILEDY